jgi:hypothetical protein
LIVSQPFSPPWPLTYASSATLARSVAICDRFVRSEYTAFSLAARWLTFSKSLAPLPF